MKSGRRAHVVCCAEMLPRCNMACNMAVLAGLPRNCYRLLKMKRVLAVIAASAYLSFSHYCLSYAVVTGQAHCPPPAATEAQSAGHHHEAGRDDEGHHGQDGDRHDHSSEKPERCCTSHDSAALTNGAAALNVDLRTLGVVYQASPSAEPQVVLARIYAYPNKHGPPGRAKLKAFPPQLTSRPPPFLASL